MKEKNKITLILCTILTVLLISIITIAVIDSKKTTTTNKNTEVFFETYLMEESYKEEKDILRDKIDYETFIDKYNLKDKNLELDFSKKDYIYYISPYDSCSEKIINKELIQEGKKATINFDVKTRCGICAEEYILLIYEVDKNSVEEIDVKINVKEKENCDYEIDKKPILYLYPTNTTNVSIKLKHSDRILTSYPKYEDGWFVEAHSNGDLYDQNNKYYYALYWDEKNNTEVDFKKGFYVTKENAIFFLEEKLETIGLNKKEKNEFIMYWLPVLENNEQSLVYFELTEERQNNNELIIEPKPDSLLRINMHIKKVDNKVNIKEQNLPTFQRAGFVAVEWGGTIHSN